MKSGRGGARLGAGSKGAKHADSEGVNKAVTVRITEEEALALKNLPYTNRQILMAGVRALQNG